MDSSCIFCQIRDREIPKEFTYEDSDIMVFPDIYPLRPVHLLIVPKEHIVDFGALNNDRLLIKAKNIIQKLVKEQGLDKKGYRIGNNSGGAQQIDHLHFHLMSPVSREER